MAGSLLFLCSKDRLHIFNLIFLFLEYLILRYFKHKIVITIKLTSFVWYRISYITLCRIGYYMQPIENGVKTRFYKRIPSQKCPRIQIRGQINMYVYNISNTIHIITIYQ